MPTLQRKNMVSYVLCLCLCIPLLAEQKPVRDQVSLGKALFHDPILSKDYSISCASCHKPEFAFSDTSQFSVGVHGKLGNRNTPSVMNMFNRISFFWDGRAATLAEQALFPIENPAEMSLPVAQAVQRLRNNRKYVAYFKEVFGELPTKENLGLAVAAFEESLESGGTPNDRWLNDEDDAMTASQIRGRKLFREKAKCFDCHFSPDFTGDEFRNIGLFDGDKNVDSGRYFFTKNLQDIGKFKVPGLRNIAITAPYMHDGRFNTLREVIDYYDDPSKFIKAPIGLDSLLQAPLHLTEEEKVDLENFLHALTDPRFAIRN